MADPKIVICTWKVPLLDLNDKPLNVTFDIVDGNEPLIIGDSILKHSNHVRLSDRPKLEIQTPNMSEKVEFASYSNPGESRPRLMVVPADLKAISSMYDTGSASESAEALVKKIHGYSHDNVRDMRRLLKLAGKYNMDTEVALRKVCQNCDTCIQAGIPLPSRKVSIKHIDKDFNQTVFVDFFFFQHGTPASTNTFLHARCARSGYSEINHVDSRDMSIAAISFERMWITKHGAPQCVGGDPEFDKERFRALLRRHGIKWEPRPARRHNQVGIVERKNRVAKDIMQRLSLADPYISPKTLAARTGFLSNLFAGSRIASSFEMARGYTPGIAGLKQMTVNPDLIRAHLARSARRALQRLLTSHKHETVRKSILQKGKKIWFFDKDNKWHQIEVSTPEEHFVRCRRKQKGPALKIAYEDIRLAPSDELDEALLSSELEGVSTNVERDSTPEADEDETAAGNQQALLEMSVPIVVGKEQAQNEPKGNPDKDTGKVSVGGSDHHGTLKTSKSKALEAVYKVIGHDQVMLRDLEFAPPWLVNEAYQVEEANWDGVYEVVNEKDIPKGSNIISSHVVYKMKVNEDESLKLKARICPHGNRDKEKDGIRKDSASVQFPTIRLMLSITALLGLKLGSIDISAAYLQSGPITREIFVRPPKEHHRKRGTLWKLIKLPYGIAEAGRQWQTTCEAWLLSKEVGFENVVGVSQLFSFRHDDGDIRMLCAKVTDDFLFCGTKSDVHWFDDAIRKRFDVGKTILDGKMNFNGASISQDTEGNILLSMEAYMGRVSEIPIDRSRRKEQDSKLTAEELKEYRGLAGRLNWAGQAAIPVACFAASDMLQRLGNLRVKDICTSNGMLAEIKKLNPTVLYKCPKKKIVSSFVASFSDAAFNISSARSYGQNGFVSGIAYREQDSEQLEIYVTDWNSNKQRRVCYSSFGAEILAAADGDDRTYNLRESIRMLFSSSKMPDITGALYVDSRALLDTITTLHEGQDYRLRQTVQRIRDSFEAGDLDTLVWIPGTEDVADALTKRNPEVQKKLSKLCSTGVFPSLPDQCRLDSKDWK